jgi:hypothetical protein
MSVSVATDRPTVTRRLSSGRIIGGVLVALALIAAVVAIAFSDSNSSPSGNVAPTGARGQAAAVAAPATLRDPVTHALIPLTTPAASDPSQIRGTPGPGYK